MSGATGTAPPVFDPDATAGLPAPAARWLRHAIAPGTAFVTRADLRMHGEILLRGRWSRFTAQQESVAGRSFRWAATTRVAGLPVRGYDRYADGVGEMRWKLLGLVPVVRASGPDVSRSAAGRLAAELVLVPAAALGADIEWVADDERHAVALVTLGGRAHRLRLCVAAGGALESVELERWGSPDGGPFGLGTFRVSVDEETRYAVGNGALTVPSRFRASWDGVETYRCTLDSAAYR